VLRAGAIGRPLAQRRKKDHRGETGGNNQSVDDFVAALITNKFRKRDSPQALRFRQPSIWKINPLAGAIGTWLGQMNRQ
jgi:hypothetical protein